MLMGKKTAKWADIKAMHNTEVNQIVKLPKLTEASVYPKPIESQRISTSLQVFCNETLSIKMCIRFQYANQHSPFLLSFFITQYFFTH